MNTKGRNLKFCEAIREATAIALKKDPNVYIMGLGVPDPKGLFGTTLGLQEEFGSDRVFDMPISENAMTGVAIGSAISGMRPILTHQRVEFALLSIEQIVNQAAKWYHMTAGKKNIPLVIRMIIGRGWGQGAQHSQSLESWFGHIPGLKVVMPATPYDAKGLLIQSIRDNDPVIFCEHKSLYGVEGEVSEESYVIPFAEANVMRDGGDATIVAYGMMVGKAMDAAKTLAKEGVECDVIDLRTLSPIDMETVLESVENTGRLVVVDESNPRCSIATDVSAQVAQQAFKSLKAQIEMVTAPHTPVPFTTTLEDLYIPSAEQVADAVRKTFN